jgi:molecular chaperone HscA
VLEKSAADPVVRAFDATKERWNTKVPGGESLLSVGDGVLVGTADDGARYLDGGGKERLGDKGNGLLPVRVNGGSVLLFGSALNPYPQDLAVSGFGTRSGAVTPLGQLQGVRGNACSWSSTIIVCPREKDFQAWTFAK